jgi:hypothetical protein
MVFLQINLTSAAYKQYAVNLNGAFKCKVISVEYACDAGTASELLFLKSSVLNFPYSTNNSLMFFNASQTVIHTSNPPEFNVFINGYIDITLIKADGEAPTGYSNCLISLLLEPIDRNPPVPAVEYRKELYL